MNNGLTLPEMPRIVYAVAREWDGKGLFLQDSDALVYPYAKLKEALEYLNLKLPDIERVAPTLPPRTSCAAVSRN